MRILHDLRRRAEYRLDYYKQVFVVCFGLMILSFVIMYGSTVQGVFVITPFAKVGILLCFSGSLFGVHGVVVARRDLVNIDGFYLETELKGR